MAAPAQTEVEAERARLQALGYSETDIREILIAREVQRTSATASAGAPPVQMPMSGVLGNATAAVSYGRAAIFGIRSDIRNVFNRKAPPLERAMSSGILAFKLVVVAVVCFAIYQEWQRHIIFETQIQKEQAASAHAEGCVRRAKALASMMSGPLSGRNEADTPERIKYEAECAGFIAPPPPDVCSVSKMQSQRGQDAIREYYNSLKAGYPHLSDSEICEKARGVCKIDYDAETCAPG